MTQASQPPLCRPDEVPDGGAREVVALLDGEETSLLLLRQGDRIEAFHNVCPHAGRRLDWAPGRFLIDGGLLVCAAHGASFSIPDGLCLAGPCRGSSLQAVALRCEDGGLWLDSQALNTPG